MAPIEPIQSLETATDVPFELQQYTKIIRFCEAVLSGHHETVRPDLGFDSNDVGEQTIASRIDMQVQRRKLERQLKDDVNLRQSVKPAKFERPACFDLSNILTKALALTQAAGQATLEHSLVVTNEAASDSHDDNTFYSSVFETPDSHLTSVARNKSAGEVQPSPAPNRDGELSFDTAGSSNDSGQGGKGRTEDIFQANIVRPTEARKGKSQPFMLPGLNNYKTSQSEGYKLHPTDDDGYITMHPPSPLLRNAASSQLHVPAAALAQLTALRGDPSSRTSADTLSQGTSQLKEKNKKAKRAKKKRKVDEQNETERPPFIKTEPRSLSPLTGPSTLRAPKRLRQSRNETQHEIHSEGDYAGSVSKRPNEQQTMQRTPSGYDPTRPLLLPEPRFIKEPVERRWIAPDTQDTVPGRLVVSRDSAHIQPGRYYGNPDHYQTPAHEQPRYATQPEGRYFYESAPTRIYVDANGREYIDPPRQVNHQSAGPSDRHGDARPYYDAIVPSTAGLRQGAGHDNVVYARPPSPYMPQRRIITEPGRIVQEQPELRYREYTTHPGTQSEQFVEVFSQQGRRAYVDSPGTYIRRATSMMPMDAGPSSTYERAHRLADGQPHQYPDGHRVFARGEIGPSYVSATYSGLPENHRAETGADAPPIERITVAPGVGRIDEAAQVDRRANDGRLAVYTDGSGRKVVYR